MKPSLKPPSKAALADTVAGEPQPRPRLEPGARVKQYELIRELGVGGMGMVFLARDTRLGRLVAIKFLLEHTGRATLRFLAEARTTAQCRHENIVVIYDVDELDGYPYIVLEYIEGRTLRAAMAERRRDGVAAAIEIMSPVARALARAHSMGIVHRDLKPENILLSNAGQVMVVDFGIATHFAPDVGDAGAGEESAQAGHTSQTQDGPLVGTMPYMAPEQWLREPLDARADIWAAGLILFELATGAHPLNPLAARELIAVADLDAPMPSARAKLPDAPELADVIDRCLKKRKEERLGSAAELAEALERLGAGGGAQALGEDESPFAGLASFQESDAARFFGRDSDIDAVVSRLRHNQLVAIAGASGAGKSSFVRAGVIPALKRAGRRMEAFVVRPGRRPLAALADVLAFFADTSGDAAAYAEAKPEGITETLATQPGYLGASLRARCRRRGDDHRILLFVDQLEELFTLGADPTERAAFCDCLEGVADDASSPLRVIVTIRADFIDRLADDRRFLSDVTRGLMFLPPIGREGLRDALTKPIEAARYRFEDEALVDEMLDGLSGTKSPLPILQFTATKLWEARDHGERRLTRAAYVALGGVAGALSTHADAVLAALAPSEQRVAREVFVRLVTAERTRAVVPWDELAGLADPRAAGELEQVLLRLADARLLSIERGSEREGRTVELAHESLIESWGKLSAWLDENEQDAQFMAEIRGAAAQWEKNGESDDFVWRDRAATAAGLWLERRRREVGAEGTIGLAKREERYLEAVVRLMERARRRRRRAVAGLFTAITLVAILVSVLAIQARAEARRADEQAKRADEQSGRADAQAIEAQEGARRARNATRLATAREMQDKDPTTMLALLREIEPGSLPRRWAPFALWARWAGVASAILPHESAVHYAAFSPDGARVVLAGEDAIVRVWRADGSGEPVLFKGHEGIVHSAAFSPDGKRLVSASADKTVRVWNADGSGQVVVLRGHTDVVRWAAFSPDGARVASASWDKTARVWSADGSGQPVVLKGHDDNVYRAVFSPDGARVVSASADKTVRVWSADGAGQALLLHGHDDFVYSAAFSPDGARVVSASADKTVRVWSADGAGQPFVLSGHADFVYDAAFSPDSKRVASASADKTVRVWDADGSRPPLIFRGHDDLVRSAAFSPDGTRVVSASYDKTARVWSVESPGRPIALKGHEDSIHAIAFSPDGERIASASDDKTVRVWRVDGAAPPVVLKGHEGVVYGVAFSPDGRRVVSSSEDKTARVWSADGSGPPLILKGHDDFVYAAGFSPDGAHVVSSSLDRTARVWSADGSGPPIVLKGHTGTVFAAAFSPDGERVVSGSSDKTLRVWSADGSGTPLILQGHKGTVLSASFSPDGEHIVSGSDDNTLRVWNADGTGAPVVLEDREGEGDPGGDSAFSPDGRRVIAPMHDGTVRIWNADGSGEAVALRLARDPVSTAQFSPDGLRIAAASDDNTVMVWSDIKPLKSAADARLWTASTYCMPLEVRRRLLDFPDDQSRKDLESCRRHVAEAARPTSERPSP